MQPTHRRADDVADGAVSSVHHRLRHAARILSAALLAAACTSTAPLPSPAPATPVRTLAATPGFTPAPTIRPVATPDPTPRPTPAPPPADDRTLGAVYAALRPTNLRSALGPRVFTRGSHASLLYEITNTSSGPVSIPTTLASERAGPWYGVVQGWLEVLEPDASLDACMAGLARQGAWYALGGGLAALGFGATLRAGEGQTASVTLPPDRTMCLPVGSYRYHLEYRRIQREASNAVIATVSLEFELRRATEWTAWLTNDAGQLDATLAIPTAARSGTGQVTLIALEPGAAVSIALRTAACDGPGGTIARWSFKAPADGSRTIDLAFDLSDEARRRVRAGAPLSVRLTVGESRACGLFVALPRAVPAGRAPTTWGGGLLQDVLGHGSVVTASAQTFAGRPAQAFDGDIHRTWNAGGYPPAWLEIDLGRDRPVEGLRLLPSQLPSPAETVHRIHGRPDGSLAETLLVQVAGPTSDNEWIDVRFAAPANVRYVRVETVRSPSWVAWREIELLGLQLPRPSVAPVGYHDGSPHRIAYGDQCYANGWATDADDRPRNVPIRILVDGEEVWSGLADAPRADLVAGGVADASAAFWVDLRGLLPPGTPHEVRVQGQDLETGHWFDLGGTPRTISCR